MVITGSSSNGSVHANTCSDTVTHVGWTLCRQCLTFAIHSTAQFCAIAGELPCVHDSCSMLILALITGKDSNGPVVYATVRVVTEQYWINKHLLSMPTVCLVSRPPMSARLHRLSCRIQHLSHALHLPLV